MLTSDSAQVVAPALYKAPGFDPVKDFEPVAAVATAGYVLEANTAFPANTVAWLIALAKAQSGAISYASAGNGSLNRLIAEVLRKQAGIDMQYVPYKSSAAAATDVVSGRVPVPTQSLPSSIGFIQGGKAEGVRRSQPEAGSRPARCAHHRRDAARLRLHAVVRPVRTGRLHGAFDKALATKDIQDRLAQQGTEPWRLTSAQFGASVKTELARWATIVKDSGARVD